MHEPITTRAKFLICSCVYTRCFGGTIGWLISKEHSPDCQGCTGYDIPVPMNLLQHSFPIKFSEIKNGIVGSSGGEKMDKQKRHNPTTGHPRQCSRPYPLDDCAAAEDGVENNPPPAAPNGDDPIAAPLDCAPAGDGVPKIDIAHVLPSRITGLLPLPLETTGPPTLHRGLGFSVGFHSWCITTKRAPEQRVRFKTNK